MSNNSGVHLMQFMLPYQPHHSNRKVGYGQKILAMGSCFAQEIGSLLQEHKFQVMLNPNGILFNSISITNALEGYLQAKTTVESDLKFENNLWHSLNHHGCFSGVDAQGTLIQINKKTEEANYWLKNATWLHITLGSSWVYRYLPTGQVAANCHKIPQKFFKKELLNTETQLIAWQKIIAEMQLFNPNLQVLFTVSPVKYVRDGLVENNLSKAHLLTTIHKLCEQNSHCFYFPAYELVTDVLRDYRFYKPDMVHPNDQAIQFVWEKFMEAFLDPKDFSLFSEIGGWLKFKAHTPLENANLKQHNVTSDAMLQHIELKLQALQ